MKTSVLRAGGLALFVSVALLSSVSPAAAQGAGVTIGGESNISEEEPLELTLCLLTEENPQTDITLYNTGTFEGQVVEHIATFEASTTYYFGPGGTYSDPECMMPYAVPGTLTVSHQAGGDVSCDPVSATYQRVGTAYTITTSDSTECDFKGGGANTFTVNSLTYTGIQLACTTTMGQDNCGNPPGPSPSQEFTGVYVQT